MEDQSFKLKMLAVSTGSEAWDLVLVLRPAN